MKKTASKLPKGTPEQRRFAAIAKKLRSDVAAYIADGSSIELAGAIEKKLIARRDKLYEQRTALVGEDRAAAADYDATLEVLRGFRERAAATRQKGYQAEIDRLRQTEMDRLAKLSSDERMYRRVHKHGAKGFT